MFEYIFGIDNSVHMARFWRGYYYKILYIIKYDNTNNNSRDQQGKLWLQKNLLKKPCNNDLSKIYPYVY